MLRQAATAKDFRGGVGFVATAAAGALAKWSFVGVGVELWLPTGPAYGAVTIAVDGAARTASRQQQIINNRGWVLISAAAPHVRPRAACADCAARAAHWRTCREATELVLVAINHN